MNREAKREIRRVLMGRTIPAPDGSYLISLEKGEHRMPVGVHDGAGATFFLGIGKKSRRLKVSCDPEFAAQLAAGVMQNIGRLLYLNEQPKSAACLIRYYLTRPAVLVFGYQDGIPILSAFSGRGLTGWISNRRAIKSFLKGMPKQFALSEKEIPKDEDELDREAKKKKKQEQKAARKAQKAEKAERKKAGRKARGAAGDTKPETEAKQ